MYRNKELKDIIKSQIRQWIDAAQCISIALCNPLWAVILNIGLQPQIIVVMSIIDTLFVAYRGLLTLQFWENGQLMEDTGWPIIKDQNVFSVNSHYNIK